MLRDTAQGRATVLGDRSLLGQLLSNLIENAIRHAGPAPQITVEVARQPGLVILRVRDRGPGIPEEEHAQVLRRLYRLERSRTTPGNGLGLALVQAVAGFARRRAVFGRQPPRSERDSLLPCALSVGRSARRGMGRGIGQIDFGQKARRQGAGSRRRWRAHPARCARPAPSAPGCPRGRYARFRRLWHRSAGRAKRRATSPRSPPRPDRKALLQRRRHGPARARPAPAKGREPREPAPSPRAIPRAILPACPASRSRFSSPDSEATSSNWRCLPARSGTGIEASAPALPCAPVISEEFITSPPPMKKPMKTYRKSRGQRALAQQELGAAGGCRVILQ